MEVTLEHAKLRVHNWALQNPPPQANHTHEFNAWLDDIARAAISMPVDERQTAREVMQACLDDNPGKPVSAIKDFRWRWSEMTGNHVGLVEAKNIYDRVRYSHAD